jgi:phenylalanyl-tRNA synthetase alpha subunit
VIFHDEFQYQQQLRAVSAPTQEIRELLNSAMEQTRQIQQHIRQSEREMQNAENSSFLKRLFKKSENHELKINELKQNLIEVRDHCYLKIIAIQKQASQESVYLEAKNLISVIDSKVRHYAFANGENGVTRLPLLLQLPEDRNSFNMQSILMALNYEFLLSAKSWGLSQKA